jgi:hypothetical protein
LEIVNEMLLLCIKGVKTLLQHKSFDEEDKYDLLSLMATLCSGFVNYSMTTFDSFINNNDIPNFVNWCYAIANLEWKSTYLLKV